MNHSDRLPEIHSLWIGPRLAWIELLSLHSWLAHGHRVTLWCYEPIEGVPDGVHTADAAAILPKASIIRHRQTGSVALFSNSFRYHLLKRQPVTWLDTDVVLLRPLANTSPHLFGWETTTSICNAVMRLPRESPVLSELIKLAGARVPVPEWWRFEKKCRQRMKAVIGCHKRAEDLDWGSFGPAALTHFLFAQGLADRALPIEAFYPINWTEISVFFETPDAMSARLTEKTIGVHLWSSNLQNLWSLANAKNRRAAPPPANSWVGEMCRRYDLTVDISDSGISRQEHRHPKAGRPRQCRHSILPKSLTDLSSPKRSLEFRGDFQTGRGGGR